MPLVSVVPLAGEPDYPRFPELLPEQSLTSGSYLVRFARTRSELDAVLRLRFEVFNLELHEGLEESFASRRDLDAFDHQCHHLMVIDRRNRQVVGTYRMQSAAMAASGRGFYSAGEFDLAALPAAVRGTAVEVGRACIHRDHRSRQVLFLLWRGLAAYLARNRQRFLFGCCSLTSQDPEVGRRAMARLRRGGHLHPEIWLRPLPEVACYPGDDEGAPDSVPVGEEDAIPPLFGIYLRYRGKVCGPPAIDRDFKTIDFLVLLDLAALGERSHRLFFDGLTPAP